MPPTSRAPSIHSTFAPRWSRPWRPAVSRATRTPTTHGCRGARRARRETLIDTFGTTPARWPSPLQEAVRDFHATNVEDNEHHTLIAAAKVGQDMCLAQASWQDQLPPHLRGRSAVDVLRRMTDLKRAEYDF